MFTYPTIYEEIELELRSQGLFMSSFVSLSSLLGAGFVGVVMSTVSVLDTTIYS